MLFNFTPSPLIKFLATPLCISIKINIILLLLLIWYIVTVTLQNIRRFFDDNKVSKTRTRKLKLGHLAFLKSGQNYNIIY